VNTYDPADGIRHVQMAREMDPYSVPVESGRRCMKLPTGYANGSQRTCLKHRWCPRRRVSPTSALLPCDQTAKCQRN
jgi:hypothetical protein